MVGIPYITEKTTSNITETQMNIRRVMDGNKHSDRGNLDRKMPMRVTCTVHDL